ncbi:MAG: TylF/MycF family methyltransferase [Tannerella sp.]|jgi:hypothetical protein|nr:TylF/MycF family methyltransferase [Tannerella sp.]
MSSKYGILVNLNFLQWIVSKAIALLPPVAIGNIEKYKMLSMMFYYTAVENISGDYLEFGVFTGSSFCHAVRAYNQSKKFQEGTTAPPPRFFGFDSFAGFGELEEIDRHPFFVNENFATSYKKVDDRVKRFRKIHTIQLIKGYFNESLKDGPEKYGITKARIILIDCDTYAGAKEALNFCKSVIQVGTIIIFDDYLSYKGKYDAGESLAFREFLQDSSFSAREFGRYGLGGTVYIINAVEATHSARSV